MSNMPDASYEPVRAAIEFTAAGTRATLSMAEFLMRGDKKAAQTEVTGGSWDNIRGVYSTVDSTNGITTEYKVKKSMNTQTGFAVYEKSYKTIKDEGGLDKRVEVEFDPKSNEWVKKNIFQKAAEQIPASKIGKPVRPKLMGTLVESKGADGNSAFTLRLEKAKFKPAFK